MTLSLKAVVLGIEKEAWKVINEKYGQDKVGYKINGWSYIRQDVVQKFGKKATELALAAKQVECKRFMDEAGFATKVKKSGDFRSKKQKETYFRSRNKNASFEGEGVKKWKRKEI